MVAVGTGARVAVGVATGVIDRATVGAADAVAVAVLAAVGVADARRALSLSPHPVDNQSSTLSDAVTWRRSIPHASAARVRRGSGFRK
jgi:hypothetical protein